MKLALPISLLTLLASRLLAYRCFCIFDDAFITYRYAAFLAAGHGLIYNMNETVLGTTTPVFAMLCAGLRALGGRPETIVPFANMACDLAIATLVWRFLFPGAVLKKIAFVALFALCPLLARVCVGGMEADFFVLQSLGALVLHASGRRHLAAALAGASCFTRPEGIVTVGVLGLTGLLDRRIDRAVMSGVIAACVLAPVLGLLWRIYGHVLPQSMAAKGQHAFVGPLEVLHVLLAPEPVAAAIAVLGVAGLVPALLAGGVRRMVGIWFVAYVAAYLLGGPHVWSWYGFPPLVMACVLAAPVAGGALAWLVARAGWREDAAGPALLAAVALAWVVLSVRLGPDPITSHVYVPVAAFCRNVTAGDTVLASDIGIVGYRCPARIIDAAGLVSPSATQYRSQFDLIQASKPSYLFLNASAEQAAKSALPWFVAAYAPVARFAADGDTDPAHIRNRGEAWHQEYVAYRHR